LGSSPRLLASFALGQGASLDSLQSDSAFPAARPTPVRTPWQAASRPAGPLPHATERARKGSSRRVPRSAARSRWVSPWGSCSSRCSDLRSAVWADDLQVDPSDRLPRPVDTARVRTVGGGLAPTRGVQRAELRAGRELPIGVKWAGGGIRAGASDVFAENLVRVHGTTAVIDQSHIAALHVCDRAHATARRPEGGVCRYVR